MPVYVLEYLPGMYCATDDPEMIGRVTVHLNEKTGLPRGGGLAQWPCCTRAGRVARSVAGGRYASLPSRDARRGAITVQHGEPT
ncbi:MAG: hypothetical protein ACLFRJ_01165 [Ectothiorhodospira sp.]